MEAQLKRASVRLVISAPDRRLVSAILSRFLEWLQLSGHQELVLPEDIEIDPDVNWNSNTASTTLMVHYSPVPAIDAYGVHDRSMAGVATGRPVGVAAGYEWTFEVLNSPSAEAQASEMAQFPSEVAPPVRAVSAAPARRPRTAMTRMRHATGDAFTAIIGATARFARTAWTAVRHVRG